MEDISQKLKDYMKVNGYTEKSISEQLGVSTQRVNQLMNGKKPFGKKAARQWHELFGVNEYFLLTGKGDVSTESVTIHQIGGNNTMNNANDPNTIEAILRLTKMLEQERAEKEEWKRKYFDLINNKV